MIKIANYIVRAGFKIEIKMLGFAKAEVRFNDIQQANKFINYNRLDIRILLLK